MDSEGVGGAAESRVAAARGPPDKPVYYPHYGDPLIPSPGDRGVYSLTYPCFRPDDYFSEPTWVIDEIGRGGNNDRARLPCGECKIPSGE